MCLIEYGTLLIEYGTLLTEYVALLIEYGALDTHDDSFTRVTWLTHTCDMTISYV